MKLSEAQRRALLYGALLASVTATFYVASIISRRFFEVPVEEYRGAQMRRVLPGQSGADAKDQFRVAAVEGQVEAFSNGRWYVVQAGETLALSDVIRTQRGARAHLRRGGVEIDLREDVDIRLAELAQKTARFDLLRGNITADVTSGDETLEIAARGTRAKNRGAALFVVRLDQKGRVQVATSQGDVRFSAQGQEVAVTAGKESIALPDQPPTAPEPIPEELLLSVVWPEIEQNEARVPLRGQARPSTQIRINGVDTETGPDGSFAVSIPLAVGANRIEVEAEDMAGRKKTTATTIRRTAKAPKLEQAAGELWKQ